MDKEQQSAWDAAQMMDFSCGDLIKPVKQHISFLAAIDKRRTLQTDGPVLERAVERYMHCWLPLLEKYTDSNGVVKEGSNLMPPLDCEWVWHCHRLNPLQYKADCQRLFGKTLDSVGVKSTITTTGETDAIESSMKKIWGSLYPEEPFEIDYDNENYQGQAPSGLSAKVKTINYDLADGVKRQSKIYYNISKPSYLNDTFLEDAIARYKGFLHGIKVNTREEHFGVPVYDVDLVWHTHQLHPRDYSIDTTKLIGRLMGHDDSDTDKSPTGRLAVGFSTTTKIWEMIYGSMYWKSGTMKKRDQPTSLPIKREFPSSTTTAISTPYSEKLKLAKVKVVELILQVVDIRNAPDHEKGTLRVTFEKEPDLYVDGSYDLIIQSESGEKDVAVFECEPSGELQMTLKSTTTGEIGRFSVSLEHLMKPVVSELTVFKWFDVEQASDDQTQTGEQTKPISVLISLSSTIPITAPHYLFMSESEENWYSFKDDADNEAIKFNITPDNKIIGKVEGSNETFLLAELVGEKWSLVDSKMVLSLDAEKKNEDGHIFELTAGSLVIKIFPGRRLEYEPLSDREKEKEEQDFATVVTFSEDHPYGDAIALIDLQTAHIKVNEDWFVVFGVLLTYILSKLLNEKGYNAFVPATSHLEVNGIIENGKEKEEE